MTAAITVIRLPYDGRQQTVTRVLTAVARFGRVADDVAGEG